MGALELREGRKCQSQGVPTPAISGSVTPNEAQSAPASPGRGRGAKSKRRREKGTTERSTPGTAANTIGGPLAKRQGFISVDEYIAHEYEFCQKTYWVHIRRLGWCTTCGDLDDWKSMQQDWIDTHTPAEKKCYEQVKKERRFCPQIYRGAEGGQIRRHTCTACVAEKLGVSERQALDIAIRENKGEGALRR